MLRSYSIGQLASLMRKTERTVLRYISAGKLPVSKVGNAYMVDEDVLQAFLPGSLTPVASVSDAPSAPSSDERLDALEARIMALEGQIAALKAQLQARPLATLGSTARPAKTPVATPEAQTGQDNAEGLPDGAIGLAQFAAMHGIARTSLLDAVTKGRVEASARPKSGRPNEMERYFLPAQQARVIAYWKSINKAFTPCERCPHGQIEEQIEE